MNINFTRNFYNLVTGNLGVQAATSYWIQFAFMAATAAASLYSGYKQKQAYEKGGEASRWAAFENAGDLRDLAAYNSAGYREAGAVNAGAIRTVGEANAIADENSTARNMMMYGMQADEDRRRHIIQERVTAGNIRARTGASGIQTNTGSPLHFLNQQVQLGIAERKFGDDKAYWTLRNMYEEGAEKASVIRLTADQQAMVTEYNANLQAEMSYAEAMRQADAMERSGEIAAQTGAAQGSAAMWGGITNAMGSIGSMWSAFGSPSTNAYSYTGSSWAGSTGVGPLQTYQNTSPYGMSPTFNRLTSGGYAV